MANSTQYAKIVAKQTDGTHYQNVLKPSEHSGTVRVAYATYTFDSAAEGTVVNLFNIPKNARLISGTLVHDDLGTSVELDIGYAAHTNAAGDAVALDADKFLDGTDVSSAGKVSFLGSVALGFGAIIDTDDEGFVMTATTVDADGTNTTSGTITVIVEYVVN
jgi:hypothetical protein